MNVVRMLEERIDFINKLLSENEIAPDWVTWNDLLIRYVELLAKVTGRL